MFEESFTFLNNLKEDKYNIIYEENSVIIDEEEKTVRTSLNVSVLSHVRTSKKSPILEEEKSEESDGKIIFLNFVDHIESKSSVRKTKNNKRRSSPINSKKKKTNKK